MTVLFINGWGVSEGEARSAFCNAFGSVDVSVVQPGRCWRAEASKKDADTLIAYSLGAFLVLREPGFVERFSRSVLLAPFVDFRAESGRGGKVRSAQLKYLLRWLSRSPLEAVNDFRERAGFMSAALSALPMPIEELVWGIRSLAEDAVDPEVFDGARGIIGGCDSLLDAEVLRKLNTNLRVVPELGHELPKLLAEARGFL